MPIDRRSLLIGAGAAIALPRAAATGGVLEGEIFAASGKEAGGGYAAIVFDAERGEIVRLERMMGYCESTECRTRDLLEYFGEPLEVKCGTCGNCRVAGGAAPARPLISRGRWASSPAAGTSAAGTAWSRPLFRPGRSSA